jgi:hypothetical protein
MAVDRGHHFFLAGLDVDHKAQQSAPIIGLREALSMQQPALSSSALGSRKPSVVTKLTLGCSGQTASSSEQPSGGGLSDGDRSRDADHKRRTLH